LLPLTETALIVLEKKGNGILEEGGSIAQRELEWQGYARRSPYFKNDTRFVYLKDTLKTTPVNLPTLELTIRDQLPRS
jgi:hypothetical protein